MDSYLNIASLALAIAALVPILLPNSRTRLWTITAGLISSVILLITFQAAKDYEDRRIVKAIEDEVMTILTNQVQGLTFDQIFDRLYRKPFPASTAAVDALIERKEIFHKRIEVRDLYGSGRYIVRVYYKRGVQPNN